MAVERERSAWICAHKTHEGQAVRKFLLPGEPAPPKCDKGHTMVRQPNKPYMKGKVKK